MGIRAGPKSGAIFNWARFSISPASASAPPTSTARPSRLTTTPRERWMRRAGTCKKPTSSRRVRARTGGSEDASDSEPILFLTASRRVLISIYNGFVPGRPKLKPQCPICKKPVAKAAADYPFCSDRCRLIDLGKWASGQYVVSSPVQDTDEAEIQNPSDPSDEE